MNHYYLAIDLKSFYASVECIDRGLDPLHANLVVADQSRTEKTICLAVSPSLKAFGIPGRPRLFEVVQKIKEVNARLQAMDPEHDIVTYITAVPRMARYMEVSTDIYKTYLKYVAPEDIHVYSIDEVFIDVTAYLETYKTTPKKLAKKMILDVLEKTGITATAGIGTNLYLAKVAMDIVAKHISPEGNDVRIAELDENSYRKLLWSHTPLTDFWRVGKGYAKKLMANGIYTMGDIARCSIGKPDELYNEELLYKLFGINAELLIDHAWGWEPCTIKDIKNYKPENNSIGSGQVLHCAYDFDKTRIVVREMTELLVLDLVDKGLLTDQIVLTIGYDIENTKNPEILKKYNGKITKDYFGRSIPEHAHGSVNLNRYTSSTQIIVNAILALYDRIVNPELLIRRLNITANHIIDESSTEANISNNYEQLDLFTDYSALEKERKAEKEIEQKEKALQHAMLDIKKKYGKNAILKGTNLQEGATAIDRNNQIGGHKA
ncbi:MAG: DNA methylase [Butyrivibrio sp.]|nr:DNA methylase [Butyrivibrio sp.]